MSIRGRDLVMRRRRRLKSWTEIKNSGCQFLAESESEERKMGGWAGYDPWGQRLIVVARGQNAVGECRKEVIRGYVSFCEFVC